MIVWWQDAIKYSIMNGHQGVMPTGMQNGLATDADVNNITQYILGLIDSEHDATAATEGKKTFKRICRKYLNLIMVLRCFAYTPYELR